MADIGAPINDRVVMGSNSTAYGETLRDDIETILADDHEKLFHFAKWHIDDYIAGTVGMKLETEGAYIRFLMRLYQRGKPLPDDDRFMSIVMNLSIRVWRRIKDSLIAIGKIVQKGGCLTNPRFEKERKARAEQLRKQAEATRKRWERERAKAASNDEVCPKFRESLPEVSRKLSQSTGKKVNEINEPNGTQLDITRVLKRQESKKEEPPIGPPQGDKPKRKTQFPVGWLPSEKLVKWAIDKTGATPEQVADEFEDFRDFHQSKGNRFLSWGQAFQTWMRRAKQYGRLNNQPLRSRYQTSQERQQSADEGFLEREIAEAKARGQW